MERFDSVAGLRAFIQQHKDGGKTVSFVPTMGALHEGHKSCVDIARGLGGILVVSIFVNPTQFGSNEDLASYPVTLADDLRRCEAWGCDAVFVPSTEEMYPTGQVVWIEPGGISKPLCGRSRQGHFRGVTTVVCKLFHIVLPDVAVFGQKDAQQALVIRQMVEQLNLPVGLVLSPTIRESDGLACSSRNRYLAPKERKRAAVIYKGLQQGRDELRGGQRDPDALCETVRRCLVDDGVSDVEYVQILRVPDLTPIEKVEGKVLLAVAVRIGKMRLIDNMVLNAERSGRVDEVALF